MMMVREHPKNIRTDEAYHDGSSHANNVGSPDILFGDTNVVADLRKQRSDGEPNKESTVTTDESKRKIKLDARR